MNKQKIIEPETPIEKSKPDLVWRVINPRGSRWIGHIGNQLNPFGIGEDIIKLLTAPGLLNPLYWDSGYDTTNAHSMLGLIALQPTGVDLINESLQTYNERKTQNQDITDLNLKELDVLLFIVQRDGRYQSFDKPLKYNPNAQINEDQQNILEGLKLNLEVLRSLAYDREENVLNRFTYTAFGGFVGILTAGVSYLVIEKYHENIVKFFTETIAGLFKENGPISNFFQNMGKWPSYILDYVVPIIAGFVGFYVGEKAAYESCKAVDHMHGVFYPEFRKEIQDFKVAQEQMKGRNTLISKIKNQAQLENNYQYDNGIIK
jgi:hypothetical protein